MSEVNIEVYSGIYKIIIADLILNIQKKEFGIPITLNQQPDLNEYLNSTKLVMATSGLPKLVTNL